MCLALAFHSQNYTSLKEPILARRDMALNSWAAFRLALKLRVSTSAIETSSGSLKRHLQGLNGVYSEGVLRVFLPTFFNYERADPVTCGMRPRDSEKNGCIFE